MKNEKLKGMSDEEFEKKVRDVMRGHPGRGDRGACGEVRLRDGSGRGIGNRNRRI